MHSNFGRIFSVALTCVFSGGLIGAVTNMINGSVSPYYFRTVMNWDFVNIWTASVAQGIFEGLLYGFIFAIIFTTGFGLITRGQATYKYAFKLILKIVLGILTCWTIGGLIAITLSLLSPEFYQSHFRAVPEDEIEMMRYAWVGGSIWGGMLGGLISLILGVVMTKNSWTKQSTANE